MSEIKPRPFKGIAMPFHRNGQGGVQLVEDSVTAEGKLQTDKLIKIAMFDNTSQNPFQDLGTPESMIFATKDGQAQQIAIAQLTRIFRDFGDRLVLEDLKVRDSGLGEMSVEVSYSFLITETRERTIVVGP